MILSMNLTNMLPTHEAFEAISISSIIAFHLMISLQAVAPTNFTIGFSFVAVSTEWPVASLLIGSICH